MREQEAHKKAVGIVVVKETQVEIIDNHTSHPLERLKSKCQVIIVAKKMRWP